MGINLGAFLSPLVCGFLASFFNEKDMNSLVYLYGGMAGMGLCAGLVLLCLTPTVRKLMGDVK